MWYSNNALRTDPRDQYDAKYFPVIKTQNATQSMPASLRNNPLEEGALGADTMNAAVAASQFLFAGYLSDMSSDYKSGDEADNEDEGDNEDELGDEDGHGDAACCMY